MDKKTLNKLLPMMTVLILSFSGVCYASDGYNFAAGLPWDNLMTTLGNAFTGEVPRFLAVMAMATTGIMLMFGETGGLAKTGMQIVFGIGVAINAGDWVTFLMNGFTADASSVASIDPVKAMTAPDFISSFMMNLQATCMKGAYNLQAPVLKVLGMLAVIEMATAAAFKFEQDHIKNVFKQTLKIGFFAFLVQQWVGGTYGIANTIFRTFEVWGLTAAGMVAPDPDNIVANGLSMITGMWSAIMELKFGSIGLILTDVLVMLGIVLSVFFMTIELVMCKVEFWVISVITIPLLPFGILKITNQYFEKAIGAIFNLGIKLMTLSFVSAIAYPILLTMSQNMKIASDSKDISSMSTMLSVLLGCVILFVLVKRVPEMASGLLSGTPSLGGSVSAGVRNVKADYQSAASVASGVQSLGKTAFKGGAFVAMAVGSASGAMIGAMSGSNNNNPNKNGNGIKNSINLEKANSNNKTNDSGGTGGNTNVVTNGTALVNSFGMNNIKPV